MMNQTQQKQGRSNLEIEKRARSLLASGKAQQVIFLVLEQLQQKLRLPSFQIIYDAESTDILRILSDPSFIHKECPNFSHLPEHWSLPGVDTTSLGELNVLGRAEDKEADEDDKEIDDDNDDDDDDDDEGPLRICDCVHLIPILLQSLFILGKPSSALSSFLIHFYNIPSNLDDYFLPFSVTYILANLILAEKNFQDSRILIEKYVEKAPKRCCSTRAKSQLVVLLLRHIYAEDPSFHQKYDQTLAAYRHRLPLDTYETLLQESPSKKNSPVALNQIRSALDSSNSVETRHLFGSLSPGRDSLLSTAGSTLRPPSPTSLQNNRLESSRQQPPPIRSIGDLWKLFQRLSAMRLAGLFVLCLLIYLLQRKNLHGFLSKTLSSVWKLLGPTIFTNGRSLLHRPN